MLSKREVLRIPGWLSPLDYDLIDWALRRSLSGDLLEIGVYKGQSAVLLGSGILAGEHFTVCDIFEDSEYQGLTRREFEDSYLRFHQQLPEIIHSPSDTICEHVKPASCRLVHVDGDHSYEMAKNDIQSATSLLIPDGILVVDDFRSAHTPGVAAAAWGAVARQEIVPFCLSDLKMYAGLRKESDLVHELEGWLVRTGIAHESQNIMGTRVLRAFTGPPPRARVILDILRGAALERFTRLRWRAV